MVGLGRLELPTSRLSGVRSNLLSYKPMENLERESLEVRMTTNYYPLPSPFMEKVALTRRIRSIR